MVEVNIDTLNYTNEFYTQLIATFTRRISLRASLRKTVGRGLDGTTPRWTLRSRDGGWGGGPRRGPHPPLVTRSLPC